MLPNLPKKQVCIHEITPQIGRLRFRKPYQYHNMTYMYITWYQRWAYLAKAVLVSKSRDLIDSFTSKHPIYCEKEKKG